MSPSLGKSAVIETAASAEIVKIDERLNLLYFFPWKSAALTEGEHVLFFFCGPPIKAIRTYKFTAQPAHVYRLECKHVSFGPLRGENTRIVDVQTGADVGRILSASGDAVIESAPESVDYPLFKWRPTNNAGWYILRRDAYGISLLQAGENTDGLYAVNIETMTLPEFGKRDDFLAFVGRQEPSALDPRRFQVLQDSVTYQVGQPGPCAMIHRKAIDDEPGTARDLPSSLANALGRKIGTVPPLIFESYGYVCRSRRDRRIAIVFFFSHQYYDGQQVGSLPERAQNAFNRLEL